MIELIIGILIGIILLPAFICFYPTRSTYKKKSNVFNLKTSSGKELPLEQAKTILKSLHTCNDVYWVNVLINRFWCELSDSSAQAYRLKKHIKKIIDDIPGTGIIRFIEVLDVDIGIEGPTVKGIRIIGVDDVPDLLNIKSLKTIQEKNLHKTIQEKNLHKTIQEKNLHKTIQEKNLHIAYLKENGSIDSEKVYDKIFKNVHSVISVVFQGSIKIKLKVGFPKNISLQTDVFINKIEGDIITRFPSINYNTRLEYAFLRNPEMEIGIEAGVSKGDSEGYFKQTISNFIRRTIKFTVLKSFVYPSFNTLYLPLIVPSFRNFEHKISEVSHSDSEENIKKIDKIKESMCFFLAMDYKISETINDIVFRNNNFLLNDKEKIFCTHFTIPDCALNSSHFTSTRNFIYEKLTIKESKIMNQIYDLSILKDVISSFREVNTLHNYNSTSSLIEVVFADRTFNFLRIVHDDSIFFQKNDEENPEFIIFSIRNKELFIYDFTTFSVLKMTKNRLFKLKTKLEMKPARKITINKIYKYSKNALHFWKAQSPEKQLIEHVDDVKNIIETSKFPNVEEQIKRIKNCYIERKPDFTHKFACTSSLILNILSQDDVRIKFISDQTRIFRFINENEEYKSIAVENKDKNNDDFVLHTFNKDNKIFDIINNKKIVYEVKETVKDEFPEKFIDMVPIFNGNSPDPYKLTSISETELDKKKTKITFLDVNSNTKEYSLDTSKTVSAEDIQKIKNSKILDKFETTLNIYVDEGVAHSKENHLYESIYTRIVQQEIKNMAMKSDFERLDLKKEFRKDFYGDLGGVYIEFKTELSEDFKFSLYSTALKRNLLEIQKVITSRPVKLIIPIFEEDILLLKLVPKFLKNRSVEIKVVNLPRQFHRECLIDCNIGLPKSGIFTCPIIGSQNSIIFWEKENEDNIKGVIESPYTKVPISGNGIMRTDQMNYSVLYKNKGAKCREIKVYMGVTKKE